MEYHRCLFTRQRILEMINRAKPKVKLKGTEVKQKSSRSRTKRDKADEPASRFEANKVFEQKS
jgi:hypothetical protein